MIAALALATGCTEKTVRLEYRFPSRYKESYRWSLRTVTSIESPTEQTTNRLDAVLKVEEKIRREPDGRTILAVRLKPTSVTENGNRASVPPPSSAEYEIDGRGRIRRLVKADLPAGAISSLELDALAWQIRPPLTIKAVAPGETWNAPLRVKGERTSIIFRGAGRLSGFDLIDRRRLARIETHRRGRITSSQTMNNARVVLRGRSSSRGLAKLDLDRGLLFFSEEQSTSRFDILSSGRPAARLDVTLTSRLQLAPGDPRA